jgi:hypothetical protein
LTYPQCIPGITSRSYERPSQKRKKARWHQPPGKKL